MIRARWRLLGDFMRGSKRLFALGIVFSALATLFDLLNPKIIAFTVDSILGDKPMRVSVDRLHAAPEVQG